MNRLPRTDAELVPLVLGDGLSLVALALLIALAAALALYAYRAARVRRTGSTGDAPTRDRGGDATDRVREGPRETRPSATAEVPADDVRVRRWLREAGGELPQKELTARSGWSKSKTSRLLSQMEDEGERREGTRWSRERRRPPRGGAVAAAQTATTQTRTSSGSP